MWSGVRGVYFALWYALAEAEVPPGVPVPGTGLSLPVMGGIPPRAGTIIAGLKKGGGGGSHHLMEATWVSTLIKIIFFEKVIDFLKNVNSEKKISRGTDTLLHDYYT